VPEYPAILEHGVKQVIPDGLIDEVRQASLKIVRQLKWIERLQVERQRYKYSGKSDPRVARRYNLYCKKVADAKRRIKKYVDIL